MSGEKERVDGYVATAERMEPEINPVDASAFYSAAISLKRIADSMEKLAALTDPGQLMQLLLAVQEKAAKHE